MNHLLLRNTCAWLTGWLLSLAPGLAFGFDLITAEEARQSAQAEALSKPSRTRSMPVPRAIAAPTIRVLDPTAAEQAVRAPLRIELAFEPIPGTRIVPDTFRVMYGPLKVDLTERLRQHARLSETGVVVEGAQVPDGLHRLFLQVADDRGNTTEQELRIRVGAAS